MDIQRDQLTASQNLIMTVSILGLVHGKKKKRKKIKTHSLNYSKGLYFTQPTNTVELVVPVSWYLVLEYLSHSFLYMKP